MKIQAIIEMPQGSFLKYEVDKTNGGLFLDRVLNQGVPYSYGFVPNSRCPDGDPLDIFLLSEFHIYPLTRVNVEIVGAIRCLDNGVKDDKLLAVIQDDFQSQAKVEIIVKYLKTYKEGFIVEGLSNEDEAIQIYKDAIKMYDASADST